MRRASAADTATSPASADRAAARAVASETRPSRCARMRTPIVLGHHLEVFVTATAVGVFVLETHVGEVHVPIIVVGQRVWVPRPSFDIFPRTIGSAVAVWSAAIALVQEALIVALQFVVEDDSSDTAAPVADAFVSALVGAVDRPQRGQTLAGSGVWSSSGPDEEARPEAGYS